MQHGPERRTVRTEVPRPPPIPPANQRAFPGGGGSQARSRHFQGPVLSVLCLCDSEGWAFVGNGCGEVVAQTAIVMGGFCDWANVRGEKLPRGAMTALDPAMTLIPE